MRTLILFVIVSIASANVFCQTIKEARVDEFTGSTIIQTTEYEGRSPKSTDRLTTQHIIYASASYYKTKDSTELYLLSFSLFLPVDLGCFSEHDGKMMLLFEDGSTITLKQYSNTSCNSYANRVTYYLFDEDALETPEWHAIMISNMERIMSNPVIKMRVYGTNAYFDYEIMPTKTKILGNHLKLLNDYRDTGVAYSIYEGPRDEYQWFPAFKKKK